MKSSNMVQSGRQLAAANAPAAAPAPILGGGTDAWTLLSALRKLLRADSFKLLADGQIPRVRTVSAC